LEKIKKRKPIRAPAGERMPPHFLKGECCVEDGRGKEGEMGK